MNILKFISQLWSATRFNKPEIAKYAEDLMLDSTRNGIVILSLCSFLLQLSALLLFWLLDFTSQYFYTHGLLAVLSLHILISSQYVRDLRVLNMLGMVLLVVTAMAFMLLAHATGSLSLGMIASMVLLFMALPLVPWGMREAVTVIGVIYLLFTASALSVSGKFGQSTILTLQFFTIAAASIAVILVARNVYVRKHDINARFDLEHAHRQMELLSYRDPLTGAWNRRFLDTNFATIVNDNLAAARITTVVLFDVDDFKWLNDNHGHDVGDLALQRLVAALQTEFGEEAFVMRLGGDEFTLVTGREDYLSSVNRALERMQTDAAANGLAPIAQMSVSYGIARSKPKENVGFDSLYKPADVQLYEAKRRRRVGKAKMSRMFDQTATEIT